MSVGVVGRSRKPDERRLAIHPAHMERIAPQVRAQLYLERGYGERFGVSDATLEPLVAGLRDRDQLFAECDVCILPKPLAADVAEMHPGQVLWGWPHCVQDEAITQLAIDRRLTVIAWEAMNHWSADGSYGVHVFHANNELAGYCSVLHATQLAGVTGQYGRRLSAAVISFGATARGAVTALAALGVGDITVFTHRDVAAVASPIHSARMVHFERRDGEGGAVMAVEEAGATPLAERLAEHDIVVNCVLQDTDAPLMFVRDADLPLFNSRTLFIDVSCDEGMGFAWARPTSFAEPMFTVGKGVRYYAVDHSPSYLWDSSTWEISEALLTYLPTVMRGPAAWAADETIARAIQVRDGVIENPKILSFQGRAAEYPHDRTGRPPG